MPTEMRDVQSLNWWSIVNSGWFGTSVGILLFMISAILAVALYKRGKPTARLRKVLADVELIGPAATTKLGELEILYAGLRVPQVTSTTLGIWNDGTSTFRGADIVEVDWLRLECTEGTRILQATVDGATRKVTAASAKASEGVAKISFDFLDPGDGFRVRVIHSGRPGDLSLKGTIRGLPQGLVAHPPACRGFRLLIMIMTVVTISAFAPILWSLAVFVSKANAEDRVKIISLIIFMIFGAWAIPWLMSRPVARKIRNVPESITDDTVLYGRMNNPFQGNENNLSK